MNENIENKFLSSIDLKDDKGKICGAVFVSISKEFGKRDIILIDEKLGTYSVRSITELINMLSKKNISFNEKRRVLEFLSERLQVLEKDSKIKTSIPKSN
jgi:hypothetical protein